jgi:hypothetical protein
MRPLKARHWAAFEIMIVVEESMAHTSTFDIKTAKDFYNRVVLPQYQDFVRNNFSSRHALLSTIVLYHMYEWVNGTKFTVAHFNSKYPHDTILADSFELAREITNGTKHFTSRAKTRFQKGFSPAVNNGFARSTLLVEYSNGNETSADDLLSKLESFWNTQKNNRAF